MIKSYTSSLPLRLYGVAGQLHFMGTVSNAEELLEKNWYCLDSNSDVS